MLNSLAFVFIIVINILHLRRRVLDCLRISVKSCASSAHSFSEKPKIELLLRFSTPHNNEEKQKKNENMKLFIR